MIIDGERYVYGEIKPPLLRRVGTRLGYIGMCLKIPGASWLYFRSLLGGGEKFTEHNVPIE